MLNFDLCREGAVFVFFPVFLGVCGGGGGGGGGGVSVLFFSKSEL